MTQFGIANRATPSLPTSTVPKEMEAWTKAVDRWAGGLPFAAIECEVWRSTNQTIATATTTAVVFDTVLQDTGGFVGNLSATVTTSGITIPGQAGGYYIVHGRCIYVKATQIPTLRMLLTYTDLIGTVYIVGENFFTYDAANQFGVADVTAMRSVPPGGVFQLKVRHTSGINETLNANGGNDFMPSLHIARVAL